MQISDDGQFFYESMNPAFERSLGISIEGEKAIHDCMSEVHLRFLRCMSGQGKGGSLPAPPYPRRTPTRV
jgi:hypothetical protein